MRIFRRCACVAAACLLLVGSVARADSPPAGLPPLMRYQPPEFPVELAVRGETQGHALIAFTVDQSGRVDDAFALAASHPAFADSVLSALRHWQLKPAASRTMPRREVIRFAFRREGTVTALSQMEATLKHFPAERETLQTLSWDQLAAPPQRIGGAGPSLPGTAPSGRAVVSYVIDPEGRVRVPVVVSSTDAAFAASALAAVKQWRYAPPRYRGGSVAVTVAQAFNYGPAKPQQ